MIDAIHGWLLTMPGWFMHRPMTVLTVASVLGAILAVAYLLSRGENGRG